MGASGHEDGRQVPERQGTDDKTRHDLVADAEIDHRIEGLVRERDGRGQGDHVAGEEGQFHARLALCDPVAHGRHTARHLRRAAASRAAARIRSGNRS